MTGFEPATFCTPCRRASQVTLHPGEDSGRNRLVGVAAEAGQSLRPWPQYDRVALVWQRGIGRFLTRQRIGAERVGQRQARVQAYEALPLPKQNHPPPAAPANDWKGRVAAVFIDGGRVQVRDERWGLPPAPGERRKWWREPKAASLITFSSLPSDCDPHPEIPECLLDPLWIVPRLQELKRTRQAGVAEEAPAPPEAAAPAPDASSAPSGGAAASSPADEKRPRWSPPPLVRSVVATLGSYEQLGRLARVEAYHRNFPQASRKAFLADGHLANWGLWEREFSDYVPIVDLLHALSYVYQAARDSTPDMAACWERYADWTQRV